jgi:hypothetical protein
MRHGDGRHRSQIVIPSQPDAGCKTFRDRSSMLRNGIRFAREKLLIHFVLLPSPDAVCNYSEVIAAPEKVL